MLGFAFVRSLILFMLALFACDDAPARHATQARPMDEPRAQEVIARTFQAVGFDPEPGRTITLVGGHPVKLEVAAAGRKFGVIWLTPDLRRDLGALLPKHDGDEGSLVILEGLGADTDSHALALWETDYMTDDLEGASHSATEIAAERKLERDIRDFLVKAKNEAWP